MQNANGAGVYTGTLKKGKLNMGEVANIKAKCFAFSLDQATEQTEDCMGKSVWKIKISTPVQLFCSPLSCCANPSRHYQISHLFIGNHFAE